MNTHHLVISLLAGASLAGDVFANEWEKQATEDAKQDRTALIFDGQSPNKLACDTALRTIPDGLWVMVMLGGGDTEPRPQNGIFITHSADRDVPERDHRGCHCRESIVNRTYHESPTP